MAANSLPKEQRRSFNGIAVYVMWNIWQERNHCIFQHASLLPSDVAAMAKEDILQRSTEDDSVESNSSRHEFLQVAKARLIAHVYLIDWLTGSSKEHRNASHIPAVQCLNSDCLGGNALGIAFLQVILRNINGLFMGLQPIWSRPGKLSCDGAVLVNDRIMYQEISASTLGLNPPINGNPSCFFNLYGGDEYPYHYYRELVSGCENPSEKQKMLH